MFSSVQNFLYQHRRKFYFSGLAIGSLTLISKVAQHRLLSWQDDHAKKLLEQQKRKRHYERTLDTTRIALLQLIPNVRKVLERELDSDTFLQAIKEQPQKKLELWEQLKIVGFGRAVCTVVCGALAASVSHVMMMVLAANTLDNEDTASAAHNRNQKKTLSVEVQAKYLSCLQDLIEEQLPELVSRVMDIASNSLSSLPLTRKLTLPQLESILQQITLSVTNNKNVSTPTKGGQGVPAVLPWSQYLKEPTCSLSQPDSTEKLHNMYLLTVDILNTDDFNEVINTLVQTGLNYVLDEMAAYYFNNSFAVGKLLLTNDKLPIAITTERSFRDVVISGNTEKQDTSDTTDQDNKICQETPDKECSSDGAVVPCPDKCSETPVTPQKAILDSFTGGGDQQASCLVVKLVPMLNGIVHRALPNVRQLPGHMATSDSGYYNRLVVCSQLETLTYNVYDTLVLSAPTLR